MKYIRLGIVFGLAVLPGQLFSVKAEADPLAFYYWYYLNQNSTDYSHRTIDLDHTYYSSKGTHADSIRSTVEVHFYSSNNLPSSYDCNVDAPLYITTSGGTSTLTTLVTIYSNLNCSNTSGAVWYTIKANDLVQPLALWTSYAFGGDVRSDDDAEAYLDFLCAYGSNWAANAGSYDFEIHAGSVNLNVYNAGNLVTWGSFGTFKNYPAITVNFHCHLK